MSNPFSIRNHTAYRRWRDQKLANYVTDVAALITRINGPENISAQQRQALTTSCESNNFAIYQSDTQMTQTCVSNLGVGMGLTRIASNLYADNQGVSEVRVSSDHKQQRFVPYTNRLLNWHTDGYYYSPDAMDNMSNVDNVGNMIQSFILHCVESGADGGENHLLDHEIAYILLRDENPDYIAALMNPEAMTIPANQSENQTFRDAVTGPVFAVTENNHLWMRYTARTRSIHWHPDPALEEARAALTDLLENSEYIVKHTLSPGQGLICNNILHNRTSFRESEQQNRLLYRIRYFDRIRTHSFQ